MLEKVNYLFIRYTLTYVLPSVVDLGSNLMSPPHDQLPLGRSVIVRKTTQHMTLQTKQIIWNIFRHNTKNNEALDVQSLGYFTTFKFRWQMPICAVYRILRRFGTKVWCVEYNAKSSSSFKPFERNIQYLLHIVNYWLTAKMIDQTLMHQIGFKLYN